MVQVHTQLTQQEFIQFNFKHLFRTTAIKVLLVFFSFIFIINVFGTVSAAVTGHLEGEVLTTLISLLIFPGLFALLCSSVYFQSKRNYASTKSIREPITYSFDASGIHIKGDSFESDLKWSTIHKVQETKRWFLFYQNNVAANIVPKSSFESQEQLNALRELISSQKNLKFKLDAVAGVRS